MKYNILIVDDNLNFADVTCLHLETTLDAQCFSAQSAESARRLLKAGNFHLLITDIRLEKEEGGFELAEFAKSYDPTIKVMFMTFMFYFQYHNKLSTAKFEGLIHKDSRDFILVVKNILNGEKCFRYPKLNTDKVGLLTNTEHKIVKLIVLDEQSNKEIAETLEVSEETVKTHRKNIYRKLGINSSIALTKIYLQSLNPFDSRPSEKN